MAHVHSEYLEEEVGDQEAVQMEMVEETVIIDVSILPLLIDAIKKLCKNKKLGKFS